jgi:pimeloyl-ACP methyl ester carboxylesterase
MASRNLYATLIGINDYKYVTPLRGCIKDILNIDEILRGICDSQQTTIAYHPLHLLAPASGDTTIDKYKTRTGLPIDPVSPTFKNITQAGFNHLRQAKENDICLLYFSGHGSYIATPENFEGRNTRQCETLVCLDSRTTARDLVDKEIAFLLHEVTKDKPNLHCLVIMDCCHSGDNTRSIQKSIRASDIRFREAPPSNLKLNLENYIGYSDQFFKKENGSVHHPAPRHVQLAACRNHEKARDQIQGGLFSTKLATLLKNGGASMSYNQLVQSLSATVTMYEGFQNPTCYAATETDLDLGFLGSPMNAYRPSYEVRYFSEDENTGTWKLMAGSLQGIVPTTPNGAKTIITIESTAEIDAEVSAVDDFTSTLQGDGLKKLAPEKTYSARLTMLAIPKLVLRWPKEEDTPGQIRKALQEAFDPSTYLYIQLDAEESESTDFHINTFERADGYYFYLSQISNDIPLFKAQLEAKQFLSDANAMGKWTYLQGLENLFPSQFTADDFEFTVETIEGTKTSGDIATQDVIVGEKQLISPKDTIALAYVNEIHPAFRLSVKIKSTASFDACYIEALYLDSSFGVRQLSDPTLNRITKTMPFDLGISNDKNEFRKLVRVGVPDAYDDYNIDTITEHVKIFVSTRPQLSLKQYLQSSLELERKTLPKRSPGIRGTTPRTAKKSDWAVFNFSLSITKSPGAVTLGASDELKFAAFTIDAPKHLGLLATLIKSAQAPSARALKSTRTAANNFIDPQPAIWGETMVEALPFGDSFGSMTGDGVIGLELHNTTREKTPMLRDGEEIVIRPSVAKVVIRSADTEEETIIPFGYDQENDLYYPLGYTDLSGAIHIQHLPAPTAGSFAPKAIVARSIGSSIKLYFKKIFRRQTHQLALHYFQADEWHAVTDASKIKKRLSGFPADKVLPLIIHGIFGDTRSILESLKTDARFATEFPSVLSFDYENLSTTIEKSAIKLKEALQDIGLNEPGKPKLTIIAHSMGGLVSRWFIEKEGGHTMVDKLVMAGTPNGGSEWGKAGQQIMNGLYLLLTHALNVTGPLKWVISGVGFFIKKLHDPKATLKAMDLNSEFIKVLAVSELPATLPYYMVGSDTGLLESNYTGDDPFFKKMGGLFKTHLLYPGLDKLMFKDNPNDMAVTLKSMQSMHEFADDVDTAMLVLPGDHISYFSEPGTRKAILDFVSRE